VGFFVYRHLGLLGCNIAIMKRFLPLLMLTGLLFSQDTTEVKFIISDLTKVKNFNGVISSENVLKYLKNMD